MVKIIERFCYSCNKKFTTTDSYQHKDCITCINKEKEEMMSKRLQELRKNKTLEERISFLEEQFCTSEYNKKRSRYDISTRII